MSPSNSSSQGHHKSSFDSEISEETLNSPLAHQRPQSEGSEGSVRLSKRFTSCVVCCRI